MDFRPRARCRTFDAPHQFAADLHLVHWLDAKGYEVDVISDDLLHAEGASLLAPYLGGPYRHASRILDLAHVGCARCMVGRGGQTSLRRRQWFLLGDRGRRRRAGDYRDPPLRRHRHLARGTGRRPPRAHGRTRRALGHAGRPPQARLGVGFCGQGFDRGAPYRKTDSASHPRWSWIFAGIDEAVFGAGRSLVLGHGAAGFEIDRTDPAVGTPEHTVVLATADGFTDAYQTARERVTAIAPLAWRLGYRDPGFGPT